MSGPEPTIPPLEGTLPGAQPGTPQDSLAGAQPGTQPGAPAGTQSGTQPAAPAPGAPAGDDLIGRELSGRYRIVQKVGEGAMGAVYIGEHVRMGRHDAIKVLRGPLAGDAEAVRRFNRGARNISAVHHPNVCTIYDFSDSAEGVTFMAMELITGESLRDLLEREGALPPERAVTIARQVADALQAAHDAGIVHRDLKPANIMLTRGRDGGDVVKVVDFDIAKAYDEAEGAEVTRVGFVVGTPEYMSPEQLIGERLDGRSDLYSLGLVLFRMLTGALPFRADTPQDLMLQRLTAAPMTLAQAAPGRAFPEALEAAIRTVLAIKPAERQPSAAAFARDITAALGLALPGGTSQSMATLPPTVIGPAGSGPPTATPAQPAFAPPAPGPRGRRPALLAGAGVGALLLVAGGIAWFARPTPAREHARAPAPPAAGQPTTSAGATPTTPAAPAPASPRTEHVAAVTPPHEKALNPVANASAAPAPAAQPARVDTTPHLAGRPVREPANGYTAAVPPPEATPPAAGRGRPGFTPEQRQRAAVLPPEGTTPAAGPGRPGLTPEQRQRVADARVLVWRLFDRLGPPYPPRSAIVAIRDSARGVFQEPGAGPRNRALAAFIVGNTFIAVDARPGTIVPWLERAVNLDPNGSGYQRLLDDYRSRIP